MLLLVHFVNFAQVWFVQQGSLQDFASQVEPWPLVFRCSFSQFSGANCQAGRERSCTCWFTWWCLAPSACRHVIYLISISVSCSLISSALPTSCSWSMMAMGCNGYMLKFTTPWRVWDPKTLQPVVRYPWTYHMQYACCRFWPWFPRVRELTAFASIALRTLAACTESPQVSWPPWCGECSSVDLISCARSGYENQASTY